MKFSCQIVIAKPRAEVTALFDNPDNLQHWQEGFMSMTPLSDVPNVAGAKAALVYQMGKRRVEMIETLEVYNMPDEFTAVFEAKGVWNRNENHFSDTPSGETLWLQHNEFRLGGFLKVMGWLMPGMFKKQSNVFMQKFKDFAEAAES